MLIIKNSKRVEAIVVFPTVKDLILTIKSLNDKINFENDNILLKTNKIFNELIGSEGVVQYIRLSRWIPSKFEFKKANILNREFWIERGWSEEFTNNKLSQIQSERIIKASNSKKINKDLILFDGNLNNITYKSVFYKNNIHPECNICKNKLLLVKRNINNEIKNFYYEIKKCSNEECVSHSLRKTDKYVAYLPAEIAENKLDELTEIYNNSNYLCEGYWLNKGYSEEETKNKISKIQKDNSSLVKNRFIVSKDNLKDRGFSDEEISDITLTPTTIDFWKKKGLTEEDAKLKISEIQTNNSKKLTAKKKLNPSEYSATTKTQYGYWMHKGLSEENAKNMVSKEQKTFSLEICIKKYGEEEGIKKFKERQCKWLSSYKKLNYSKISQLLFWEIINSDNSMLINNEIYFATNNSGVLDDSGINHEFRLNLKKSFIIPDFFMKNKKKIIEFDGTYFHRPTPENKKRELIRDANIIESGFQILHITEEEYKKNKEEVINKCLKFLFS